MGKGFGRIVPHRDEPLLASLSHDPDQPAFEVDVLDVEAAHLRYPKPGAIQELEDGPVAKSLFGLLGGRGGEPSCFGRLQDRRKAGCGRGAGKQGGRVVRDHPTSGGPDVERANRGGLPSDARPRVAPRG